MAGGGEEPRFLEAPGELLESAGYRARCFSSAQAILDDGLSDIDVLITDIGLLGVDGFELRNRARAARPDLPVFLITGRHEIADQSRAQGISGFFRKPFDGRLLLAAVTEALPHDKRRKDHDD